MDKLKSFMKTKTGKTAIGLAVATVGVSTGNIQLLNIAVDGAGIEIAGCIDTLLKIGSLIVGWI